ncbi:MULTISPECIES: helix-turn-helix transcriptional regulator [Hydrogenophaga]|uniref:Transcriptional regulator n=1 Tax=Hydrogenophaga electricum TaxID=1230953 RepID=A0ABQ6C9H2_9BURK|nr:MULTISPECIES: AraC family transcriptional regulator [Hydrogenophaga]GLS15374.1 transcriptional regulator [Hydrogenophaga electricum]
MRIDQDRPYAISARGITSAERVMWITPDRVFYAGLLGTPTTRNYGALFVYVALDSEVKLSIDGQAWQSGNVAVLQPYTSHRVACDARHVVTVMMEPESVDMARLPGWLRDNQGVIEAEEFRRRVLRAHQEILRNGHQADAPMFDFDELVFGTRLPARSVDPRIAQVLERIRTDPSSQALAQDCAEQVHLSFSRFLHLFKSEVGASFRSFRTWKRARSLLHYVVDQRSTLTDVALGAGYPDSTHFSHSIRQVYGLKPKDIFAGSRKLRVIGPGQPQGQYA